MQGVELVHAPDVFWLVDVPAVFIVFHLVCNGIEGVVQIGITPEGIRYFRAKAEA